MILGSIPDSDAQSVREACPTRVAVASGNDFETAAKYRCASHTFPALSSA